ncbi:MAG TPA: hypothetical protein VLH39_07035, partial [Magnetospirillaceae bacterium]|nr:hypothetical protein [Magnetospirillaceae bacterium]
AGGANRRPEKEPPGAAARGVARKRVYGGRAAPVKNALAGHRAFAHNAAMASRRYEEFAALRESFRDKVSRWSGAAPALRSLQEKLAAERGRGTYAVETPVVYNGALDEIGPESLPRWILIADNPGRREQESENRRYLVGQSGRLAEGFFRRELGTDFRKEVLIVNKTPVHTPRTADLAFLSGMDKSGAVGALLEESQTWMAGFARSLHRVLGVPVWICGKSELRPRGIFGPWFAEFSRLYREAAQEERDQVLVFSHFSMNQFAIELARRRDPSLPLAGELRRIGSENRAAVYGF